MRVAKLDSSIEERLQKVEDFLSSVGISISANYICIRDITHGREYRIDDIDLSNSDSGMLPRAFDSERLILIEGNE